MATTDPARFLHALAERLRHRTRQSTPIRLRRLLRQFGYQRRSGPAVLHIKRSLHSTGLTARLSVNTPPSLEDPVVISLTRRGVCTLPAAGSVAARQTMPASTAVQPSQGVDADRAGPTVLSDIAERAIAATVQIVTDNGVGAGFIVDAAGLVATARHVIADGRGLTAADVPVRLADRTRLRARVVRSHHALDYALLWLDGAGPFAMLPLGRPSLLRPAETVIAVGHPSSLRNTVSRGIVSSPAQVLGGVEYIQTDAAIGPGNSGGPLLNARGEVVGIFQSKFDELDNGNMALPLDYLADDIASILALGRRGCAGARYCRACGDLRADRRRRFCPRCGFLEQPSAEGATPMRNSRHEDRNRGRSERVKAAAQRAVKKHAEAQLDAFLRKVSGRDPEIEKGMRHLAFGTAEGAAFVVPDADGDMRLTVVSEVMTLPSEPELAVGLLRQALEINFMAAGAGRLAVTDNALVATAFEDAGRMADDEYGRAVHSVMGLSDAVGPELRRLFDRTTRKRKREVNRS